MSSVLQEQRIILKALFDATSGSAWSNKVGWNTFWEYWFGLSLENDFVVKIDLTNNGLRGSIPPQLGQLSNLRKLWLPENDLEGNIPPELGRLHNLAVLNLESNNLSGSIPRELGSLEKLEDLDLSNNELTGIIPPELGSLQNLERLRLGRNKLTGPFPAALIGRLQIRFADYSFRGNSLSLPEDINTQTDLTKLNLSFHTLVGNIPPQLGELSNLRELQLNKNSLEGNIPPELGGLQNLENLHLHSNKLTGNIPPQLGQLSNLRELHLFYNKLTGNIPPQLGELSNLRELHLSNNKLTGSIPPQFGDLSHLRELWLSGNNLEGPIPNELGQLTNLMQLDLSNNDLSGFPAEVAEGLSEPEVSLAGYPWVHPPAAYVCLGLGAIRAYFRDIAAGSSRSPFLKLVLLGQPLAGKTLTVKRLIGETVEELSQEGDHHCPRTVGINMIPSWTPDCGYPLDVTILDFAGQEDYFPFHQLFLTSQALYLLVVNLHAFSQDSPGFSEYDHMYRWLDALDFRAPDSTIIVVGSHLDLLEAEKAREVLCTVVDRIQSHLEKCGHRPSPSENRDPTGSSGSGARSLRVAGKCAVSTVSGIGFEALRQILFDVARPKDGYTEEGENVLVGPGEYCGTVGVDVPTNYLRAYNAMTAVREGCGIEAAERSASSLEPCSPASSEDTRVLYLKKEDALHRWRQACQKHEGEWNLTGHFDEVLYSALEFFSLSGKMLVTPRLIHLDPSLLNELLRRLADHNVCMSDELTKEVRAWAQGRNGGDTIQLQEDHERFCSWGEVTDEYLHFLWQRKCSDGGGEVPKMSQEGKERWEGTELFKRMVDAMIVNNALIPVVRRKAPGDGRRNTYVAPVRLPPMVSADELTNLPFFNLSSGEAIDQKRLLLETGHDFLPIGFLDQCISAVVGEMRAEVQRIWRGGIWLKLGPNDGTFCCDADLLLLETRPQSCGAGVLLAVKSMNHFTNSYISVAWEGMRKVLKETVFYDRYSFILGDASKTVHNIADDLERHVVRGVSEVTSALTALAYEMGQLKSSLSSGVTAQLGELLGKLEALHWREEGRLQRMLLDRRDVEKLMAELRSMKRLMLDEFSAQGQLLQDLSQEGEGKDNEESEDEGSKRLAATIRLAEDVEDVYSLVVGLHKPFSYPDMVVLLPLWDFAEQGGGLSDDERKEEGWKTRLDASPTKKDWKGTKEYRLFIRCAFDNTLVPSGIKEQGYPIILERQKHKVVVKMGKALLFAASVAVTAPALMVGGSLLAGLLLGTLREVGSGIKDQGCKGVDALRRGQNEGAVHTKIMAGSGTVRALLEQLEAELEAISTDDVSFVSFKGKMQRFVKGAHATAVWVLNENAAEFERKYPDWRKV